ncbi:MAG: sugar ABC transporter ATP-binding protein [Clostridium sp.]|jgi:putative multiple sugar transport system ATP-binding protein|nr:sugar ABC transporter ATP-binding protein [Clostridium sp.]
MSQTILSMRRIVKDFSGVRALNHVNMDVTEGEIHAICGENGAGKSTLMNVLSGVIGYGAYSGEILFDQKPCVFRTIRDSEKVGIVIIHQELAVIPYFSIAENMFLGNERGSKYNIDHEKALEDAAQMLQLVGLRESPYTLMKDIGVGKQQLCEIAKALTKNVRLLILDEPTASLNESDSMHLLNLLLKLKEQGITSIIISHKLDEIAYVADRVTVIRDGQTIETLEKKSPDFSQARIIKGMVGRELADYYPKRTKPAEQTAEQTAELSTRQAAELSTGQHTELSMEQPTDVIFELKDWTVFHPIYQERRVVNKANITLRRGEVVGIAGLIGAGRTELAMSAFGHSYGTHISGKLLIHGEEKSLPTVRKAIEAGLAYVTEDRKGNGLFLSMPIFINNTMARMTKVSRHSIIDKDKELTVASEYQTLLHTKAANLTDPVGELSGGNQQKVLLAKWMFADPDIFILDEPTRGIDVAAKYEIYTAINQLIELGKSVLLISSDMSELLGMTDRLYVMNEGSIVGELSREEASSEKIMSLILQANSIG